MFFNGTWGCDLENVVLTVFTGIIIAAVSSWITVRLSMRKFRTDKWREKKVEVYTDVIEALHDQKAFSENHLNAKQEGKDISEKKDADLRDRAGISHVKIEKVADTGAFILSTEAIDRINRYKKESKKAGITQYWEEYLMNDLAATDSCLKDIIRIAKKDLQI